MLMRTTLIYTCLIYCAIFTHNIWATDFKVEPYINVQEIFSDNINLDDTNKDSDFVTVLQPGLYATRDGSRLKARFNYAPEFIIYAGDAQDDDIHNLRADAIAELWKDHFFLDFSANNGQQNINSGNSLGADNISNANNREDIFSYRINPFWKQKISDYANLTIGHTYDEILSDIGDSNSNFSYLNIKNGNRFKRLLFDFEFNNRFVEIEGTSDDIRFTNIQNRFIYPVTRNFSATATIGYDDDDIVQVSDSSGVLWLAGFIWKPSKRTSIDFSAGERYFGSVFDVDAEYAYSKTQVRFSFNRFQQTARDALLNTPSEILYERGASGLIDEQGNLIDDRTFISPTALDASVINQSGETFVTNELRVIGIYTLKRDIFQLGVFYDDNESRQSTNQIETYGADASWNHRLTRTLQSRLNLVYQNSNLETGVQTNDYLLDLVFIKNVTKDLNLAFGYSHSIFESDSTVFPEFSENRVFVGINKVF